MLLQITFNPIQLVNVFFSLSLCCQQKSHWFTMCLCLKFFMHKCRYRQQQFGNEWWFIDAKTFGHFSSQPHDKIPRNRKQTPQTSTQHHNKICFNRCLHPIILNGSQILVVHNVRHCCCCCWTRLGGDSSLYFLVLWIPSPICGVPSSMTTIYIHLKFSRGKPPTTRMMSTKPDQKNLSN